MITAAGAPVPVTVHHAAGATQDPPAILVLPGGGYRHHAPHEAEDYADWLSGLGFDAVVLRYTVGEHVWPTALQQARAVLAWLRRGRPVGVIGSSAGGHLAAALSTATRPDIGAALRPDFCALAYPVITFETAAHTGCTEIVLGDNPTQDARRHVSVDRHVDAATPPTFIWTTADDASVPAVHSLRYAEALTDANVPVELHVFPHGRHGLGLATAEPGVGTWTTLCERWMAGLGLPVRKGAVEEGPDTWRGPGRR